MSVFVVGSVALDTVKTPFEEHADLLGGSASYAAVGASFFSPVNMVGVAAGDSTCVITGTITAGGVKCWGRNDSGQLADGTTTNRTGAVGATGLTTACDALDCGDLGFDCGAAADRCGGMLACGTCSSPEYCGGGGDANECGGCLSTTCAAEGVRCGEAYDTTCAVAIDCGPCGGGDLCAE